MPPQPAAMTWNDTHTSPLLDVSAAGEARRDWKLHADEGQHGLTHTTCVKKLVTLWAAVFKNAPISFTM